MIPSFLFPLVVLAAIVLFAVCWDHATPKE